MIREMKEQRLQLRASSLEHETEYEKQRPHIEELRLMIVAIGQLIQENNFHFELKNDNGHEKRPVVQ